MNPMFDKLKKIEDRYEFLTAEISRPDIIADNSVWKKLVKEHSGLQDVVNVYREWNARSPSRSPKAPQKKHIKFDYFDDICLT